MPLEIDFRHLPAIAPGTDDIVIGLINNMPDGALESTEAQFTGLLRAAAGSRRVRLRFYYLPEVPRAGVALEHVTRSYWPVADLLSSHLHALIVTGMEPTGRPLREEPYWGRLAQLVDWAETQVVSSVWSCLAAHAAVEHLDGVERRRRPQKLCGVFEHSILGRHPLMAGVSEPLRLPHSRWNDLPIDELRAAGYSILSWSAATGADMFLKSARHLLIGFQGHPEYEGATLLKEYRRDVGRFLSSEQSNYPELPRDYFTPEAAGALEAFRCRALAAPSIELLLEFPSTIAATGLKNVWRSAAARIYRNWLDHVVTARIAGTAYAPAGSSRDRTAKNRQ